MFNLQSILISILIGIAACGVTAFTTYRVTKNHVSATYELTISQANEKAAKRETELTNEKVELEKKLEGVKNEINADYEKRIKTLNSTVDRLRADNVRLRDPGTNTSGVCTSPGNPGSTSGDNSANSGDGSLSNEATGFLLDFAREADTTLEKLRSCQLWVNETKKAIEVWNKKYILNQQP